MSHSFSGIRRGIGALALGLAFAMIVRADEAAVRQDLDQTLARYKALFTRSFELPFRSAEISALISAEIARATQEALGLPLRVKISHFTYEHQGSTGSVKAHLADLPPQQKAQMEQQANQLLVAAGVDIILRGVAFEALEQGIRHLAVNKGTCSVRKETAEAADLQLDGAKKQIMPGLQLQEAWFRLDRKAMAISGINFSFTNGTSMLVRLRYRDLPLGGGKSAPIPKEMLIKQDTPGTGAGPKLPRKMTVEYGTCTLKPAG